MKRVVWKDLTLEEQEAALQRPASQVAPETAAAVRAILDEVRRDGPTAIRDLTQRFDGYDPAPLFVTADDIADAGSQLPAELRNSIILAYTNIKRFHDQQGYKPYAVETMPGLRCTRNVTPVQRVGLYIPGGTAPLLSTVLMLGIPSQIAGNPERILCTPANRQGTVHPAILFAAQLCGMRKIARVGGAQAIAGLAYGALGVAPVDKIFGPGNIYVTLAKTMVAQESGGPAFDMPAGPSEVLVIVDAETPDVFAATDLLSQAEHDPSSQVILIAPSQAKIDSILIALENELINLPRADIARKALTNSLAILASTLEEAIAISNRYAPEHLILCFPQAERFRALVINAGSVFCGMTTPESLGDYASGTNHVLPTAAAARAYSGIGVESFQKTTTWQSATPAALEAIGPAVIALATAETLEAHARAVDRRLNRSAK